MIAIEIEKEGEFFKAKATVQEGPNERWLFAAEHWWRTIEGVGQSRNSGKATAYALQELAAAIITEEGR